MNIIEKELFKLEDTSFLNSNISKEPSSSLPLAVRLRPKSLDQFVGQEHILGKDKLLRRLLLADRLQSAVFYGPTGSGKTTLGYIIAKMTESNFIQINAVSSNLNELRKCIDYARKQKNIKEDSKTIVFIDEIHRFNKAQQDVLMPAVENGIIILIGATTHNPAFSLNGPLLSRSMIFELNPLTQDNVIKILTNAISNKENGFGNIKLNIEEKALKHIAKQSSGDARRALNALEIGIMTTTPDKNGIIQITQKISEECLQKKIVQYDHDEDYHYDTISAFIKSMRGSDVDASIYWLAKMLYAGEDPLFIARRIVILAAEDIGNADPHAITIATSALKALQFVGMPEGRIILSQAVTYMATAPKSNSSYLAIEEALNDIKNNQVEEVPQHLRDKSYKTAKRLGKGEGYIYPHNYKKNYVIQEYKKINKNYYKPTSNGYEKIIKQRMNLFKKPSVKEVIQ